MRDYCINLEDLMLVVIFRVMYLIIGQENITVPALRGISEKWPNLEIKATCRRESRITVFLTNSQLNGKTLQLKMMAILLMSFTTSYLLGNFDLLWRIIIGVSTTERHRFKLLI